MKAIKRPTTRNYQSLFNYVWQERALVQDEAQTFFYKDDFLSLAGGQESTLLDGMIEDVLNLVQKTLVATRTAPSPGLAHQMTQAALNPMGILPFGPSRLVSNQGDTEADEANIKSHHPVPMSAEDDLPFLQLFSPFSATSQVSVLPSAQNQPLRQRRQITLRSRDVPGLFTARIDMVVNAMNLNILALKAPALEPCARPELGPFVDKICSGDCNRTMQHNVGILSWAMGEWYRVAVQREIGRASCRERV